MLSSQLTDSLWKCLFVLPNYLLVLGWGQEEVNLVPRLFLAHTHSIKEEVSLDA